MAYRIKLGDLFEFEHGRGVSYGQVTHTHPDYRWVLRIFEGVHKKRPKEFGQILEDEVLFSTPFLINLALKKNGISKIGNFPIATKLQDFPRLKSRIVCGGEMDISPIIDKFPEPPNLNDVVRRGDEIKGFHVFDGLRTTYVSRPPNDDEWQLSFNEMPSIPVLLNVIEIQWRPDRGVHFMPS